jgi:glutamate-5-semialdehyde dehydrogenase
MTATSSLANPADLAADCTALAQRAKAAGPLLAQTTGAPRDRWLLHVADALEGDVDLILQANTHDLAEAEANHLAPAQLDRLRLTPARLSAMAQGLRTVAGLPDPIGQVREGRVRPNGLQIQKIGVPLGVILFIYEARPNVTTDAAGLCVKSGNALILRGGSEARHSNAALVQLLRASLAACGLPVDSVQVVDSVDRAAVGHLLRLAEYIDLVIPRGGEGLIRRVVDEARMPVLKHFKGNCHVYVERSADLDKALAILVDGKCRRPGVCNATESLLVDAEIAATFLPLAAVVLMAQGVALRGCPETCRLVPSATPATDEDFAAEFLDLILSIKVVADIDEAMAHIARFGSGHTEAIVTNDLTAARRFTALVDAAAVMVNASTRFHDGGELGLGAEIGISTDKVHARGACGLLELTSTKTLVLGDGHVRG